MPGPRLHRQPVCVLADGDNLTRFTGRDDDGIGLYDKRARYYSFSDHEGVLRPGR